VRRLVSILVVVAVCAPAHAAAGAGGIHEAAKDVRNTIAAAEAYAADHNGYAGMTVAKLRRYDKSVRRIAVRRATKRGYCIQSTSPGPVVHYDGPGGPMRKGRCGVRGAVYVAPSPTDTPLRLLMKAELAIDMYHYNHDWSYLGMTLEELQKINYGLRGVTVKWATRDSYCVETDTPPRYHLRGPGGWPAQGSCPTSPLG
jgi:hypothetical protein